MVGGKSKEADSESFSRTSAGGEIIRNELCENGSEEGEGVGGVVAAAAAAVAAAGFVQSWRPCRALRL